MRSRCLIGLAFERTIHAYFVAALLAGFVFIGIQSRPVATRAGKIRVGTFDNRAVAIVYVRSEFGRDALNKLNATDAKARGEPAAVATLERTADRMQWHLHRQGFGVESVHEYLDCIADKLPGVAEKHNLAAIAWNPAFVDESKVELVDVTESIIDLYKPDENARQMAMSMIKLEPEKVDYDFED